MRMLNTDGHAITERAQRGLMRTNHGKRKRARLVRLRRADRRLRSSVINNRSLAFAGDTGSSDVVWS